MWSICVGGVVLQQKPPVGGLVANRAGCHGCTGRVAMPGRRQGLWGGRWVRAGAARAWAELAEPVRGPSSSHSAHHKLLPLAELPEAGTAHPMPPAQPLALAASPGSTSPLCRVPAAVSPGSQTAQGPAAKCTGPGSGGSSVCCWWHWRSGGGSTRKMGRLGCGSPHSPSLGADAGEGQRQSRSAAVTGAGVRR